jgi:hypothetical protein
VNRSLFVPVAAAFALGACGTEAAKEETASSPARAPATPAISGTAPAPGEIPSRRPTPLEAKLLPPKAVIGADPDPRAPTLVFESREKPDQLLDWLRATANGADFVLESEMQEGAEHVFSGRARASDEVFTVRIAPGVNGGTTGILLVAPR